MVYKDNAKDIEYLTVNLVVPRISFRDVKPYLTDKVVPTAIRAYAEKCASNEDLQEPISGSLLYKICVFSQEVIDNSLKLLNESIYDYKLKKGRTDICESVEENTLRLWENAKVKMLKEKYFEEIMFESINRIKSGKVEMKIDGMTPEAVEAAERIVKEINFELNKSDFVPETNPLGKLIVLIRGEKK